MPRKLRIARTGRNFPADGHKVDELHQLAHEPPTPATMIAAKAASARYGLRPPPLGSELGARCHTVAMTRLVDSLAQLIHETRTLDEQEKVA